MSSDNANGRVSIRRLRTGVPGFDEILGGGLPEYSFNIIAGAPGCGKTTLAHQFVFANAGPDCPALYFTVLGEPAIKMLRYQQQFTFFDQAKLNGAIRFINLSATVLEKDLSSVLEEIVGHVLEELLHQERAEPGHQPGKGDAPIRVQPTEIPCHRIPGQHQHFRWNHE